MFAANTYDIHVATEEDGPSLGRLSELDAARPLQRPVLIGQINGDPVAAISLADFRIVADPQRCPDQLRAYLRIRAGALRAYAATPSLRARMLAALSASNHASPTRAGRHTSERRIATEGTTANGRTSQRPARRRVPAIN
jgi:hypothetical protein